MWITTDYIVPLKLQEPQTIAEALHNAQSEMNGEYNRSDS
jgi:hypothetical protein